MKESKVRRDIMRKQGYDEATLIAESQFQKAQLRRLQKTWAERIDKFRAIITNSDNKIKVWKEERQQRSIALQRLVFDRFVMLNANGESKNLNEIFSTTTQGAPPSGAGECAAPKLLQYAYSNGYQPLAMAEFWVGKSPKDEVRHHGHFYPSCKAKCEPILQWMLQGLNVEPNPLENTENNAKIDILYEDEWIIAVDKPEGMLSVPGKLSVDSLQQRVQKMFEGEDTVVQKLWKIGAQIPSGMGYKQNYWYEEQTLDEDVQQAIRTYIDGGYIIDQFPQITFTAEEQKVIDTKLPAIQTFISETEQQWIMGSKDVTTSFDEYMKSLQNMGMDEVVEVYNNAYQRYMK
jgi:23S rRNA-/tRNA-specific pseudouridylate synthase